MRVAGFVRHAIWVVDRRSTFLNSSFFCVEVTISNPLCYNHWPGGASPVVLLILVDEGLNAEIPGSVETREHERVGQDRPLREERPRLRDVSSPRHGAEDDGQCCASTMQLRLYLSINSRVACATQNLFCEFVPWSAWKIWFYTLMADDVESTTGVKRFIWSDCVVLQTTCAAENKCNFLLIACFMHYSTRASRITSLCRSWVNDRRLNIHDVFLSLFFHSNGQLMHEEYTMSNTAKYRGSKLKRGRTQSSQCNHKSF